MEERVEDGDEVEHARDGGGQGADLVGVAERLAVGGHGAGALLPDPDTLRVALAEFAGITGAASLALADLVGLEAGLVIAIDGEGDGADQCLPEEPDAVLLAVDDVDAPDENAAEEQAEHADGDPDAAPAFPEIDMAEAW